MNRKAARGRKLCNDTVILITGREKQPEIILKLCAACKIFPIGLGLLSLTVSFNTLPYIHLKLKDKILLFYVMKFKWKSRFIVSFILKFNVSVVISQVTTRTLYLRRNIRKYPLTRRLGGPQYYS
jgi:hypothetical protein